jgi:hypothetical protein
METTSTRSETVGGLVAALAKAQGAFTPIKKSREVSVAMKSGGRYTYSYATLDSVLAATVPALSANGIALTATVGDRLTIMLMHGEEWISSSVAIKSGDDWQAYGSALTYARRYLITTMLAVASEEDDDARGAGGHDDDQQDPMSELWGMLEAKSITKQSDIRAWCEKVLGRTVPTPATITPVDYKKLLAAAAETEAPPATPAQPAAKASKDQITALIGAMNKLGITERPAVLVWLNKKIAPRKVDSRLDLTPAEAKECLESAETELNDKEKE